MHTEMEISDRGKIMSDYQDRLLWMGTQTAARGVLAIYLQESVILAATLCLLPREFHCTNNAFWKSMIFLPAIQVIYTHSHISNLYNPCKTHTTHCNWGVLSMFAVAQKNLFDEDLQWFLEEQISEEKKTFSMIVSPFSAFKTWCG